MDGLSPPFYVTTDVFTRKPLIWTERGQHLVATIEHQSDGPGSEALQIARLFTSAPHTKAALKALLAAGYTREFEQVAIDAISKSES